MNISFSKTGTEPENSNHDGRKFTNEEVQSIIKRALDQQKGGKTLDYNDLLDTAHELGISPDSLNNAIREQYAQAPIEQAREQFLQLQKEEWRSHLVSYCVVNFALLCLSLITGGGWFIYPALFWGIGLAMHTYKTFYPSEREIQKGVKRIFARQKNANMLSMRKEKSLKKSFNIDIKDGALVIEKGDNRIEIGGSKKSIF